MSNLLRTTLQAGVLIFGVHLAIQHFKENAESRNVLRMIENMANGPVPEMVANMNGEPVAMVPQASVEQEMEKELDMLMMQNGCQPVFNEIDARNGVGVAHGPLVGAESDMSLNQLQADVLGSNNFNNAFERAHFVNKRTKVQPAINNNILKLQQHRSRFRQDHPQLFMAPGMVSGMDPKDDLHMSIG